MYYEIWKDAEGKNHIITDMTTQYIKNCIKQIENVCSLKQLKSGKYDENPDEEYKVLSPEWCEHFANGYLKEFKRVLNERNEKL